VGLDGIFFFSFLEEPRYMNRRRRKEVVKEEKQMSILCLSGIKNAVKKERA